MKVAIISYGHADSAIPLAKALNKHINVTLFLTLALNKTKNNVLEINQPITKSGLQTKQATNQYLSAEIKQYLGEDFPIRLFFYHNLKFKSIKNWILSLKLRNILQHYEIIHINGQNATIFQIKLLMPFKKFVFTIHDLENHSGEKTKNILARNFNDNILKSRSQVILQNKSDHKYASEKYSKRSNTINFIPFGILEVYKEFKTDHISTPISDVLFFGRISPYKGIEYFVGAVQMLKKEFPNIKAVIAGGGKFYFNTASIENDPAFIIINKFIESDELVDIIKKTKIVVCPYTDATQSGVAMTAFAFHKPVIATDTGGFRDIIVNGENGYIVPIKDSQAIYDRIILLLSDSALLYKMNKEILKFGNEGEFSWSSIAEKYKIVYQKA